MSKDKAKEHEFKDANTLSLKKVWTQAIDPVEKSAEADIKVWVDITETIYLLLRTTLIRTIIKMGNKDCVVTAPLQLKRFFMTLIECNEVPPEVTDIVIGWETWSDRYYLDTKPLPKGEIPGYERIYTRPQKEGDNASDV